MCNICLSEEEYDDAYVGLEPSDRAVGLVQAITVSLGLAKLFSSYDVGGFYVAYDLYYIATQNDMNILRAGVTYNCVTQGGQGYAMEYFP